MENNTNTNANEKDPISSNVETLELSSRISPFNLSYRISEFETEKEYFKFIKNVERLIRSSMEYKLWKNYIIDILQYSNCVITDESSDELTIEIHHHIPSLYVMVSAVTNKKIEEGKEFCTFDIAEEVMQLHFKNYVGYVPLIKSMHEKFHNGFLVIPISKVYGNYKKFLEEYLRYVDNEDVAVIEQRLSCNNVPEYFWKSGEYPGAETQTKDSDSATG